MAIIYDTTTSESKVEGVPYTTHTISHTVTSAENRILVVMITQASGNHASSVTWNGDALTDASINSGSGSYFLETFYLLAPDSGTHDLVITWTAPNVIADMAVISSFSGVKQNTPLFDGISTSSNSVSGSVILVADNCYYLAGYVSDVEPNLTGGETIISNINYGSAFIKVGYGTANTGTLNVNANKTGTTQFNLNLVAFEPVIISNNASALLNFI